MVYVVEISLGRPHQEKGIDKEYELRHRPKGFIYDESNRNDMYEKACHLWRDGNHIDMKLTHEDVPKKIKITGLPKTARLRDAFWVVNGLPLVSDPLRDLIERFDPGIHDFFPVELELPAGREPETGYSVLILRAQKDTFIPELSHHGGDRYNGRMFQLITTSPKKRKVSFTPACLKGAHIWREKRLSGEVFLSDELEAAMRLEGIRFYKTWRGDVVGA